MIGARLAPHFLHDGSSSPYTPLAGARRRARRRGAAAERRVDRRLVRAREPVGDPAAAAARLDRRPARRRGARARRSSGSRAPSLLQLPGQPKVRDEVQRSEILQRLNTIVPPRTVLRAFARVDPFPSIAGPAPPTHAARHARALARPRSAPSAERRSHHRRPPAGSASRARAGSRGRTLVVTAAHVVAGRVGDRAQAATPRTRARRRPQAGRRRAARPRPARAAAADRRSARRATPSRSSATRRTVRSTPGRAASARPPTCS